MNSGITPTKTYHWRSFEDPPNSHVLFISSGGMYIVDSKKKSEIPYVDTWNKQVHQCIAPWWRTYQRFSIEEATSVIFEDKSWWIILHQHEDQVLCP